MNTNDFKKRFLFIPVICAVMAYLILAYRVLALTGFWSFDFTALDKLIIKQNTVKMSDIYSNSRIIPREKNIGSGDIDINKATAEELDSLPGIGEKRAQAIIEQRIKMGGFSTLRDIICTEGIGAEIYNEIEPYIKIGE